MRYFYDTEFTERGQVVDLISIGIVDENGREYYAVSTEFKVRHVNDWVLEHVLPQLPPKFVTALTSPNQREESRAWKSLEQIAQEIVEFIGSDSPQLWGYCSAYDHVILSQLFKGMENWPKGWPYFTHDLAQYASQLGDEALRLVANLNTNTNIHHALHDARWNRDVYEMLNAYQYGLCEH